METGPSAWALLDCVGPRERYDRVLEFLLEETSSPSGYLFLCEGSEIQLVSPRNASSAPDVSLDMVRQAVASRVCTQNDTELFEASGDTAPGARAEPEVRYCMYPLDQELDGRIQVLAVAVVAVGDQQLCAPSTALLEALAQGLTGVAQTAPLRPSGRRASLRSAPSDWNGRDEPSE